MNVVWLLSPPRMQMTRPMGDEKEWEQNQQTGAFEKTGKKKRKPMAEADETNNQDANCAFVSLSGVLSQSAPCHRSRS